MRAHCAAGANEKEIFVRDFVKRNTIQSPGKKYDHIALLPSMARGTLAKSSPIPA